MHLAFTLVIEFTAGLFNPSSDVLRQRAVWRRAIAAQATRQYESAVGSRRRRLLAKAARNFQRAAYLEARAHAQEADPNGVMVTDGSDPYCGAVPTTRMR